MQQTELRDNHGRPLNYLRLAVTDRCNLRCFYCMPPGGVPYLPKKELLSFEEIERLVTVLARLGVSKVRLTGGEPFLRKDMMKLIAALLEIEGVNELHITTNGVLTSGHVHELKQLGITSVNLSLDTLDRTRFKQITLRDEFDSVNRTLQLLLEHDIPVKINCVVMDEKNIDDILPMVQLTQHQKVSVRFIEEMPFNGEGNHYPVLKWTHRVVHDYIKRHFPGLQKIQDPANATAAHYSIPGHAGNVGIIAAFSRTFCGSCNRIRITAQGMLKTCLYDGGVLNLKELIRRGDSDESIAHHLITAFGNRPANGFEAEKNRKNKHLHESMSLIGG